MSDTRKFVVTSSDRTDVDQASIVTGSSEGLNSEVPLSSKVAEMSGIDVEKILVVPEKNEECQTEHNSSRFRTERARMDSTSSMSTDDELDPTMRTFEEPSYIDSITSTSSSASAKPLLSSVKEMEEVQEEDLEDRLARNNTMKGLLENPSYVDSITISSPDHRRLARACRKALALRRQQEAKREKSLAKYLSEQGSKITSGDVDTVPEAGQVKKGTYVKNVVLLSVGGMLSYTAFLSLRNLQSSLNHQKGVGLISLAGGYGMFMLGSLISPFVVKALRPKRAILLAIALQVFYVAMNIYPSFYTLLPTTMIVGLCNAFLWVAVNTYLTYLAADYSKLSGKSLGTVMSTFFGIYFMIFQMNNIFGNLLSSLILFSGQGWKEISSGGFGNGTLASNSTSGAFVEVSGLVEEVGYFPEEHNNASLDLQFNGSSSFTFDPKLHCGANHCHSFPIDQAGGNKVTDTLRYILIGAFGAFGILGFVTIFFFVEALKTYKTKVELAAAFREVRSVFSLITEGKFILLSPIQVYMGLEMSFLPGDILKAFVTCPVGIEMVGYVMMGYGTSTAVSSYVSGRLHKIFGRLLLVCTVQS
ncbi:protein unc-93 homolog A-like isoform X2 [Liolophura sinensis]|uniref:protein unc-93 homolog A-like isoform X2 n=1 Tax=Liolophura sinensis TaxID=3198878 RepID=UPI0031582AD0